MRTYFNAASGGYEHIVEVNFDYKSLVLDCWPKGDFKNIRPENSGRSSYNANLFFFPTAETADSYEQTLKKFVADQPNEKRHALTIGRYDLKP